MVLIETGAKLYLFLQSRTETVTWVLWCLLKQGQSYTYSYKAELKL